jgi:uncharacterized membrane protein
MTLSLLAFGCSNAGSSDLKLPDINCSVSPPSYEQVTVMTKCETCHSSSKTGVQRANAPADVNFDTQAAAEAHAEEAASEVNKGDMPPPSTGITLSDAEKQQLYQWALCRM